MNPIEYTINTKTISEANRSEHWAVKARRTKEQRKTAWAETLSVIGPKKPAVQKALKSGITVTMTRLGSRVLDTDNLASSLKHVRDGIADALGVDDGSRRVSWAYAQEKARRGQYQVKVKMETMK